MSDREDLAAQIVERVSALTLAAIGGLDDPRDLRRVYDALSDAQTAIGCRLMPALIREVGEAGETRH